MVINFQLKVGQTSDSASVTCRQMEGVCTDAEGT